MEAKRDKGNKAEMMAGMLLRMAYLAKSSTDWDKIADRIEELDTVTQLIRDQVASELRELRHRLTAGENVLNQLDRKLAK
jgi:hypothetical protein